MKGHVARRSRRLSGGTVVTGATAAGVLELVENELRPGVVFTIAALVLLTLFVRDLLGTRWRLVHNDRYRFMVRGAIWSAIALSALPEATYSMVTESGSDVGWAAVGVGAGVAAVGLAITDFRRAYKCSTTE